VVAAQHRRAVERNVLDELDERLLDGFEAAVMVEVLGIDVGDDRDRAVEPQEAAVAFVGSTTIHSLAPSRAFEP
jgi:hypothetical protein